MPNFSIEYDLLHLHLVFIRLQQNQIESMGIGIKNRSGIYSQVPPS